MLGYLTESLYRICTREDSYLRYQQNKDKYLWICNHWIDNDYESINKNTFKAVLRFMDEVGKAPASVVALDQWVMHKPSNDPSTFGINSDLLELKDYEPLDLDDDVLFESLLDTAEKSFKHETYREAVRNNRPTEWVRAQLAEVDSLRVQPEPDIYKVDTDSLEWLGVSTEDDSTYNFYAQKASQIKMAKMTWLWPGKIPSGMVTIISGKADTGKTLCLLDWTARVTTGGVWPDGSLNTQGPRKVLLCSAEDDPARTMTPRLVAAGADLDKVIIPHITVRAKDSQNEVTGRLNVKRDLLMIAKIIKTNPDISVLILDPITSYLGGANLNRDEEIRPLMDKLILLGQKTGLTILALVHSNKRSDVDAVEKVMGASSVAAGARAVWTIGKDPEDSTLYRMGLAKGNVIKKKGGFEYRIVDAEVTIEEETETHPKIQWGKETDMDANAMLQADRDKARGGSEDSKGNIAIAILRETVPGLATDVFKKAEQEGVHERAIYRAKEKLGVQSYRAGFGGKTFWYIPGEKGDPKLKLKTDETFVPEEVAI